MGMFDSFLVPLKCPTCKKTDVREIQTKAFANVLAFYHIGDIVEEASIDEFWLKETWWCEYCREKKRDQQQYEHSIYLRLVDGLFVGVFTEREYQEQRKKSFDTYEIMRLFHKSAKRGTNSRFLLQRIYHLIQSARADWKEPRKDKTLLPRLLPKNSDELLDAIVKTIEKEEGTELKDLPPWM